MRATLDTAADTAADLAAALRRATAAHGRHAEEIGRLEPGSHAQYIVDERLEGTGATVPGAST
jgi:hypothetical protein